MSVFNEKLIILNYKQKLQFNVPRTAEMTTIGEIKQFYWTIVFTFFH